MALLCSNGFLSIKSYTGSSIWDNLFFFFNTTVLPFYSLRLLVRMSNEILVQSLYLKILALPLCVVPLDNGKALCNTDCSVVSCTFLRTVLCVSVMFIFCIYRHSYLTTERNALKPFEQSSIIYKERRFPCNLIANGRGNVVSHPEKEQVRGASSPLIPTLRLRQADPCDKAVENFKKLKLCFLVGWLSYKVKATSKFGGKLAFIQTEPLSENNSGGLAYLTTHKKKFS